MLKSLRWRGQQFHTGSALAIIVAFALGDTVAAQIPDAPGETTFAQVEMAAELTDLRTAQSRVIEARLMARAGSSMLLPMTPVPFLRIFQADGAVRGQMFVYWATRLAPNRQPGTSDRCREGICVRSIEIAEQLNWEEMLAALVREDEACPTMTPLRQSRSVRIAQSFGLKPSPLESTANSSVRIRALRPEPAVCCNS
jgi:hypothetical protein